MPDFAREAEGSGSTKFALRNRAITARQSLTEPARRAAATSIQLHLRALISAETQRNSGQSPAGTPASPLRPAEPLTVATYVPVGREPGGSDLPEVLDALLPPGGRLLLPVLLDDGDLDWARYEGPLSLQAGPRGLREPVGRRLGVSAIHEAALIIVPALAVDRVGMRLGRGGGSYDRALARVDSAFIVALLHDGELVDSVPAEEHDRSVHAAITPSGGTTLKADPDWTK